MIVDNEAVAPVGRRERLAHWAGSRWPLALLDRARSALRPDLRILAYHRVLTVAEYRALEFDRELISALADGFRAQMQHLKRHYRPVTLATALAEVDAGRQLDPRTVVVSFDDGYDDNHRIAFPILAELGVPATFFVATAHIDSGQPFRYDWLAYAVLTGRGTLHAPELELSLTLPDSRVERRALLASLLDRLKAHDDRTQRRLLDELPAALGVPYRGHHSQCRPMDWAALREMAGAGMEIGSHGATHRMLAKLAPDEVARELSESRAAIERATGKPVVSLSYPVGGLDSFDAQVVDAVRNAGYRAACSYVAGINLIARLERYALRRVPVERSMTPEVFRATLALPEVFCYATKLRVPVAS